MYGIAMRALRPLESPMGEVMQADTIVAALASLGMMEEAATALGTCELAHEELSWTPAGMLGVILEHARERIDPELRAAGRRRAPAMGMRRGLSWIGALALGEEPIEMVDAPSGG